MTDTHTSATFVALATDGSDTFLGLSETGETAISRVDSLDPIFHLLRQETRACIDGDRPLVVIVKRTQARYSTDGEKFLLAFAQRVVSDTLEALPETLPVYVGGQRDEHPNGYFHPRVSLSGVAWFPKSVTLRQQVEALLHSLTKTDEGLTYVPKRRTYVGH